MRAHPQDDDAVGVSLSLVSLEEDARKRLMVPKVRISSAEKLRREKVGVVERSMEATGVRLVDDEESKVALCLRRRKRERELLLDEDGTGVVECSESLEDTAERGRVEDEGDEGNDAPLSCSLGVVVVIDTGVAVPGVDGTEEEEGSRESLLRLLPEEDELRLDVSGAVK